MHVITTRLTRGDPRASRVEPAVATDLFWNSARPEDDLEYVYSENSGNAESAEDSECIENVLDVVFFIRSKPLLTAEEAVTALCRRALDSAPALRGWHLIEADHHGCPTPLTRRTSS